MVAGLTPPDGIKDIPGNGATSAVIPRPGVDDRVDLVGHEHRAGADVQAGQVGEPTDRLDARARAQRDSSESECSTAIAVRIR